MKQNKQIIGVLGGMGPQASCELYRLLIEGARRKFGARMNDEYPEVLIDSVPVPDAYADLTKMEEVARMLEDRISRMTQYGATSISMACNTVCLFADRLQKRTPLPVISVVDEVVREVSKHHKKVLLLASSTSLRLGLYQIRLARAGMSYMVPEPKEYDLLDSLILEVLGGRDRKDLMEKLVHLVERHVACENIEAIVLGCTELPLIFPTDNRFPVYSSLSVLAESLLKRYYKEAI
ncbi:MAG TPA: amino acid racemase [Patescibacteria group bacterium]|nr:amino acid racemase [Patescibacteria group bacterium]